MNPETDNNSFLAPTTEEKPEENKNESLMQRSSKLIPRFSPAEKILFIVFTTVLTVTSVMLLARVNSLFMVEQPSVGGVLKEGMLGGPRFINPLLAISDTDKTITSLVYSGLLKPTSDGGYTGDLAASYTVSDDGLTYDVKINQNATFQDGKPVTADDVLFTIAKAVDPVIKSPKKSSWDGVDVEKVNDKEVTFTLKKPYSSFLENLTLGILPSHIWQEVTPEEFPFSDRNINPVGSGPYKISSVNKNGSGIPVSIALKPFNKYVAGEPYIGEIDLSFFQDENSLSQAYQDGSINALGGISANVANQLKNNGASIVSGIMPRVFAAFFNQNQAPLFSNIEVRQALDVSLDKKAIADKVTGGYGIPLSGPTPVDEWQDSFINSDTNIATDTSATSTNTTFDARIEKAKSILAKAGWKINKDGLLEKKAKSGSYVLKFSISTSDVPELKQTAEILKQEWQKIGAQVDVKVFESGDLNQNVIRPRKYDMLLFGEVIGRDMDLYPFWHSSERIDPGLNISLYTNITADKLLDGIRNAKDISEKETNLASFKQEVEGDVGAIFLYSPQYVYVYSPIVKEVSLPHLLNPSDRFDNVKDWYITTENVWKIFANQK